MFRLVKNGVFHKLKGLLREMRSLECDQWKNINTLTSVVVYWAGGDECSVWIFVGKEANARCLVVTSWISFPKSSIMINHLQTKQSTPTADLSAGWGDDWTQKAPHISNVYNSTLSDADFCGNFLISIRSLWVTVLKEDYDHSLGAVTAGGGYVSEGTGARLALKGRAADGGLKWTVFLDASTCQSAVREIYAAFSFALKVWQHWIKLIYAQAT